MLKLIFVKRTKFWCFVEKWVMYYLMEKRIDNDKICVYNQCR
jgi:hypothetical protein